MLVSVDIVEKDFFLRTTKNPSIEGFSDLVDNLRGITMYIQFLLIL